MKSISTFRRAGISCLRSFLVVATGAFTITSCSTQRTTISSTIKGEDERVVWARDHGISVRSIDPGDHDFADLMPLVGAIGEARVLMLSEQSHKDGATFAARARLMRFLHERMGFDVLAFESGLWDCERMNDAVHGSSPLNDAMAIGLFPNAAKSGHHRRVFEYARETYSTPRPLEFAGFDPQFSGATRGAEYPAWLFAFFDRVTPNLITSETREAVARAFGRFPKLQYFRVLTAAERDADRKLFADLLALTEFARERLRAAHSDAEVAACRRSLENVLVLYDWHAALKVEDMVADAEGRVTIDAIAKRLDKHNDELVDVRDAAMAANVRWLLDERYPGRKIVLWAHSGHTIRNATSIEAIGKKFDYEGFQPMGQILHNALGKQVYSIGFVAYEGNAGIGSESWPIVRPEEESLESILVKTGRPYLFLGLGTAGIGSPHWLHQKLSAGPISYLRARADWSQVFDGIFFTKTMFPADAQGTIPTNGGSGSHLGSSPSP